MGNPLREKIAAGERMLGTHVNLTDHRICEILGAIGFDYLWIDMEHLSTSFKEMETHLIAARAAGVSTMVRVCWNDIPHIKRVLEAGPDAIVIPMVNSVEEARHAIDTCIYPPEGKRGFGPFRAIRYGMDDLSTYLSAYAAQTCRFLQVETQEAVEAMEEIAHIPYVDGFVIGPMDLSGSVGELGKTMQGNTDALIDRAIRQAHAAGLPIGISTGADTAHELAHWMRKDLDFLSASTDVWSVIKGARELLALMQQTSQEYPLKREGKT